MLALEAGVPVVPVTICGSRDVQPKFTLKIIPGTVKLIIGKPLRMAPDTASTKVSCREWSGKSSSSNWNNPALEAMAA